MHRARPSCLERPHRDPDWDPIERRPARSPRMKTPGAREKYFFSWGIVWFLDFQLNGCIRRVRDALVLGVGGEENFDRIGNTVSVPIGAAECGGRGELIAVDR